jgi:hypothetical protein
MKVKRYEPPYWNNLHVTENRIGRGGTAASAQGGDIPQRLVNAKFEKTNFREDPYEVDTFHRNMLIYKGPDPELFEYEQKRENTMSKSKLNLLHTGARSEFVPHHPDLFLGFTEPDPRGHTGEFDMSKLADQAKFRIKRYTKFYSDSSNTISESYRSEAEIRNDKRKGFNWVKDRMQWFSDSYLGRSTGRPIDYGDSKAQYMAARDDAPIDLNHSSGFVSRGDNTVRLSNIYAGGWSTNSDHIVKAASYQKTVKQLDNYDRGNLKNMPEVTGHGPIVLKDNYIPKEVALYMTKSIAERSDPLPAGFQLSLDEKIRIVKQAPEFKGYNVSDSEVKLYYKDVVDATRSSSNNVGIITRLTEGGQDKGKESMSRGLYSTHYNSTVNDKYTSEVVIDGQQLTHTPYSRAREVRKNNFNTVLNTDYEDSTITPDRAPNHAESSKRLNAENDIIKESFGTYYTGGGVKVNKAKTRKRQLSDKLDDGNLMF